MNIEHRTYGMLDTVLIPFKCAPTLSLFIIVQMILSGLVPTLQIVVTAYFIDTAIDIVQHQLPMAHIYPPLLAVVALIAYGWVSREFIRFSHVQLEIKLLEKLRTAIVERRAKLAYAHIENHESWNMVSRVSKDPEQKVKDAFNDVLTLASMVIRVGGIFVLLVTYVWWAALLIFVIATPLFIIAVKSGRATYQASRAVSQYHRRHQYLSEVLRGRHAVAERTLFGFGKAVNRTWFNQYETARKIEFKTEAKWFLKMKSGSIISSLIFMLIVFILMNPVLSGALSIGMFISLVNGVFGLIGMMSWQLTNLVDRLAKHREFLIDIRDFAALETSMNVTEPPIRFIQPFESLEFRNVHFTYPGTPHPILEGMTFRITAGQHYAFVGVNGAGKTTITKLLTGLYDHYKGDILLNGKSIRAYTQQELNAFFAIVFQDFARYEISMKDNIAVGDMAHIHDGSMPKRVDHVTGQFGLQPVAEKLARGVDTPLGKIKADGQDVSGGEWQRIAMARAVVSPAPVYILDEPTAALDPLNESKLYEEFERMSRDKTTLFISHRLGSTKLADFIFVIGDGRVLEQGAHRELMQQGGIYAEMYEKQRGWYE